MRSVATFVVCLAILTVCACQTLVYYCNFDSVSGVIPTSLKPTEPLSDITSIQRLTTPNNEPCILPYDYPTGNWSMYFCEWNSPSNFTCPTMSGIGNCIIGKYAHLKANSIADFDQMYLTNVSTKSNTVHCLDFFYYLTDTLDDAKISVGWKLNETTTTIVEVTALSENRWHQSRTTYISPSSEMSQIWFRMTRTSAPWRVLTYALDEIKIFEGSCDSIPSMLIPFSNKAQSDSITSQTSEIPSGFTNTMMDTRMDTDKMELTTDVDVQTTTIFNTTDEGMNITTSNTSDVTFTITSVETSQTSSSTSQTTTKRHLSTDFISTIAVSFGIGIPALLVTVGGLFYHYRTGRLKTKAASTPTNANEIPMAVRNA